MLAFVFAPLFLGLGVLFGAGDADDVFVRLLATTVSVDSWWHWTVSLRTHAWFIVWVTDTRLAVGERNGLGPDAAH